MNYGLNNKFSLIKSDFLSTLLWFLLEVICQKDTKHRTVSFSRYFYFISALNNTQTHPIKPPCCFTERPGVESDSHAYVVIFARLGSNSATQLFPLIEGGSGLFIWPKIMQRNHVIQSTHLPVSDCDIIVNTSHDPWSKLMRPSTLNMHILHLHLLKLHLHSVVSLHVVSVWYCGNT